MVGSSFEPDHPGLGRRDCADAGADFWIDTLARQQALRFVGEESGRDREYEPDHERRHTVQHGQIQRLSEGNAEQGRHEAEESRECGQEPVVAHSGRLIRDADRQAGEEVVSGSAWAGEATAEAGGGPIQANLT